MLTESQLYFIISQYLKQIHLYMNDVQMVKPNVKSDNTNSVQKIS